MSSNTPASKMDGSGRKAIVVGGGLVGSLYSIYLARLGFEVHLYEGRADTRLDQGFSGLSINLALSVRGIAALKEVGAEDEIVSKGIPMKARMIHSHSGQQTPQPYGKEGQAILSISRRGLNEHLLTVAEKYDNVHIHFEHKSSSVDVQRNKVVFTRPNGEKVEATADFVVGADGAHSAVRRGIMRRTRMDFQQFYIPHGYKELTIPPTEDGNFQLDPNHLHIWPRSTFMMIALPNPDHTFTATLFMPFAKFDAITDEATLMEFFEAEFPDSIPLIGRKRLATDYFTNPTGPLMTVKCNPFHAKRSVIIGDAAHAIVPFYGQGMNAGFEDCLVLDQILRKYDFEHLEDALAEYSQTRAADVHAIADLALYNYVEMRDLVNRPSFLVKKKVDNFLHWLLPRTFIPLYTMVTFSQIPYATVIAKNKRQNEAVRTGMFLAAGGAAVAVAAGIATAAHRGGWADQLIKLIPGLK